MLDGLVPLELLSDVAYEEGRGEELEEVVEPARLDRHCLLARELLLS